MVICRIVSGLDAWIVGGDVGKNQIPVFDARCEFPKSILKDESANGRSQ